MKKAGVFIVVVVAGLIIYFLLMAKQEKITSADFLPEKVLMTVEQRELAQLLDEFKLTPLGQTLINLDVEKIGGELELSPEDLSRGMTLYKGVETFFAGPLYREFLGRQFTIALLPVNGQSPENPDKLVKSSLLLISNPQHNTDVLQLIGSFFSGNLQPTTTKHGKYNLTNYHLDETTDLTVTTVKGYFLAAFDERLVTAGLDRFESRQGILSKYAPYLRLKQDFSGSKLFAYVSPPDLSDQLKTLESQLEMIPPEQLEGLLRQWQGWNAAAFGVWKDKGQIRDKTVMLFNKEQLDPLVAGMCSLKPSENKTLAMIPSAVLSYYWTNTLNMHAFWQMFIREMGESEEHLKEFNQDTKALTGMELDQLLSLFGSEASLVLKEIVTTGFVPLPNGCLLVKVAREPELLQMLQTVSKNISLPVQIEEYHGVKLNIIGMSPHPSLQPTYVLHQGYLILASSTELLKTIVDNPGDKGLSSDPGFQQANQILAQRLTHPGNSVSFVRFASLMKLLKDLASWSSTMYALQDPENAAKAQFLIKEVVLPLLDGLSRYDVIGSRSEIKGDAVILESSTVLAVPAKPK